MRPSPPCPRLVLAFLRLAFAVALTGSPPLLFADDTLPTIEVTAPPVRSEQPASATILTRDDLDGSVIEGTEDLTAHAPGLSARASGDRKSSFIGMRGISNGGIGASSVGIYVDDIPLGDLRGPLVDLYDVERVEVLRGPQLTTFGRAAEAGAIHIVTSQPGNTLHGDTSIRYGNYDTQVYQASVRGPIREDVAFFSLASIESRRDGYVRNVFRHEPLDDRDLLAGRARLVLRPLRALEVTLTGEGQRADDGPQALVLLDQPHPFRVAYDAP